MRCIENKNKIDKIDSDKAFVYSRTAVLVYTVIPVRMSNKTNIK